MKAKPIWITAIVALLVVLLSPWLTAQQNPPPMTVRFDGLEFPDGTIQQTAAPADPRKSYYLTETGYFGNEADTEACASGYHMAALYEMLDVSNLRYATEVADARKTADMGHGPPVDIVTGGWVRSGTDTSDGRDLVGLANCHFWTSNLIDDYGTVALLQDYGSSPSPQWLAPWEVDTHSCSSALSVWCVQD